MELAELHRTLHGTREHRRRAEEKAGGSENKMKDILNKLGLAYTAGPLADLMFDYYRQMPYESMHAEKIGLMKKFLSCFLASLTGIERQDEEVSYNPTVEQEHCTGGTHIERQQTR